MRNLVFISPNFPTNYWMFCRELKKNGLNVLGIGDQAYDELNPDLKDSLNEYYKVSNLENNDEVFRAACIAVEGVVCLCPDGDGEHGGEQKCQKQNGGQLLKEFHKHSSFGFFLTPS